LLFERLCVSSSMHAQLDRPAVAGMMVPVMVQEHRAQD